MIITPASARIFWPVYPLRPYTGIRVKGYRRKRVISTGRPGKTSPGPIIRIDLLDEGGLIG